MTENTVVDHYSSGTLEQRVIAALVDAGIDPGHPTVDQLAAVDEFHVGGRPATVRLGQHLDLKAGMRVLDIGSGLGGPARYLAQHYGALVTGIDLTPEFVEVALSLTQRTGLTGSVTFRQGDATALPYPDRAFDRAYLIHVGMNIKDKARLFTAAHRVLAPGGILAVYDIMRVRPGPLAFPVPWAPREDGSFVAEPGTYRADLEQAGFTVVTEEAWPDLALGGDRPAQTRPVAMGEDAPVKAANLRRNLADGLVAPTVLVCRRL